MVTGMAIAQNNTNSPYTRYGYGDLADQSFGNSKAMGGIAFGLRGGAQINPLNPATYTAIDSLTCIFEGGVSLQNMNISGGGVKLNAKNSSFDYLACLLYTSGNHLVFDHFAFLETKFVHYAGDTVGGEQTHQIIFQ